MLNSESPQWQHVLQNVALIALSVAFLPLNTVLLALCWLRYGKDARIGTDGPPGHVHKTVLVTGVGMTKGLVLARLFASSGDRVIGADFSPLACGRFSRSLYRFHELQKPSSSQEYVQSILAVVKQEKIDMWVSCSGVASALEDGLAKEAIESLTTCKAVQYDVETTKVLHEKSSFIDHVAKLGLTVPETHTVTDRAQIEDVLFQKHKPEKRYICKCVGMDDASRGEMTLLPLSSREETLTYLSRLNVHKDNPFIVQQFISGHEYCTHALVIQGQVKAFVACPSSELLMHYEPLQSVSPLSQAMLRFTEVVAGASGVGFTGHLSFDFMIEGVDTQSSDVQPVLYPIECNPRAHTAVALFDKTPGMAQAYHSLLDADQVPNTDVVFPNHPERFYWVGHDLVCSLFLPLVSWTQGRVDPDDLLNHFRVFINHLTMWKDGTFEWNDPLPWWWLYHIYWPAQFLFSIFQGQKWSRINVSTTKIFTC
ncbi:MAG: hypothetical protein Q9162_005695 [Coniocarpon cinnabarinum]